VRQLAAWEDKKAEMNALGLTVYGVSVDTLEQAQEVTAQGITFPMAYGISKEESEGIGAWWGEGAHGGFIQPSEFLLGRGGVVLGSMYASGQVGRMSPEEAITFITNRERRQREQQAAT
jgi:peroxiredoxin